MVSRYVRPFAILAMLLAVSHAGLAYAQEPALRVEHHAAIGRALFSPMQWWAALAVGLALLVAGLLHRVRVRQLARIMSARFDERIDERTRIARELHDALLQTVHGSKLVADRALRDPADHAQMARALEQLSLWLGQAASEGRLALQALRVSTAERSDLTAAFRRAIEECRKNFAGDMPLSVHGLARELDPEVGDEVYRIGYEAIRNACVHSRATRIDVALDYGQDLTMRISDNGVGIDPSAADRRKDSPFGLPGMQERAERIGATLTLRTSTEAGTAVTLVVPGAFVYLSG